MAINRMMVLPILAAGLSGATLAGWSAISARPARAVSPPTPPTMSAEYGGINLRRTVTVQVVQKTKDAVVNISARKLVTERVRMGGDPFWQQFDTGQVVRVPASSLGSGFIIHRDGYVVTNNHVVDNARQITVELADGRSLPADLISADPDADLAILRIHSDAPLPTMELGESNDLMIGEPVIAVGNPLGYNHSVSTGIVSAVHRDIDPRKPAADDPTPLKGEDAALRDLIQTDAAINPGNSGGPLLNAYGQVIGINTAIKANAQNIGFAIPIDRLRDLIPELMNPSQATKVDVPVKLAERRTMTEPATIAATVVSAGTPATVLQTINGRHPADVVDAYAMLLKVKAGQAVDLVWAGDKPQRLTAKPTPMPDAIVQAKHRLGLTIEQNTPMVADKLKLAREDGLLVTRVEPDSIAGRARLEPGDLIVQLGRFPTGKLDDFGALVPRFPEAGAVPLFAIRGQQLIKVILRF